MAAAVTLNVFLSLFPLLLVTIAIIGVVTTNRTDIAEQVISNLGLTGQTAESVNSALAKAAETKKAASVVGLVGLLWSGLGVVGAIQFALNATWQMSGRGIKDKGVGLLWAIGALVILGASIGVTAAFQWALDGFFAGLASVFVALAINFGFWMWTFWLLSGTRVDWRGYVPGAVMAAAGLEAIKQIAGLVPGLFAGSSALYGSIGVVFGVLSTLLIFGRVLVYASTLNVVKWENAEGTVTIDVEVPRIQGEAPTAADRSGAVDN